MRPYRLQLGDSARLAYVCACTRTYGTAAERQTLTRLSTKETQTTLAGWQEIGKFEAAEDAREGAVLATVSGLSFLLF